MTKRNYYEAQQENVQDKFIPAPLWTAPIADKLDAELDPQQENVLSTIDKVPTGESENNPKLYQDSEDISTPPSVLEKEDNIPQQVSVKDSLDRVPEVWDPSPGLPKQALKEFDQSSIIPSPQDNYDLPEPPAIDTQVKIPKLPSMFGNTTYLPKPPIESTKIPKGIVSDKTPVLKHEVVKDFQKGPSQDAALASSALAGRQIYVSLDDYRLDVMEGGKVIKSYKVGIGKSNTPTPTGEFKVIDVDPNPDVKYEGSPFYVKWLGFYRGPGPTGEKGWWGIHGPAYAIGKKDIGKNVSHGCIRMSMADVQEVYKMVGVGSPVRIEGTGKNLKPIPQRIEMGRR